MGVYKEIAKADGSGITTFYRLSEEKSTVETTSTGTTETMFDYNDALNKPSINDIALVGNKTLDELGIQPAGDYITEIPEEYITEEELEAKDYATEAFVIEQINNTEHFHREIVDALPLTGKDNILYLVPKKGSDKDIYNEYIWTGVDYEFMGTTAVDLTDYYQKNEVDELLDTKVNKVSGKQLSTNDYTTAEKTKLASLENYNDSELQSEVTKLNANVSSLEASNTNLYNTVSHLKPIVNNNVSSITDIYNSLDDKITAIRLVAQGDGWIWMDLKGNKLLYPQVSAALGHENCILFIEQLENDGKIIPAEYKIQGEHIDVTYKDLDGKIHFMTCGDDVYTLETTSSTNGAITTEEISSEASGYDLHSISIDGKSEQETRSGKNLFKPTLQTATINGITCTNNGDGTYTLNGTATSGTSIDIFSEKTIPSGTYKIVGCPSGGSVSTYYLASRYDGVWGDNDIGNGASLTFTTFGKLSIAIQRGVVCNNLIFKPMITSDTSLTYNDYESYGASPSPDYPSEIKTVKGIRNLFDKDNANILNAYFQPPTPNITENPGNRMLYIECEPNTTYTIQKFKTAMFDVGYTYVKPDINVTVNGIKRGKIGTYDGTITSVTITTDNNSKYIALRYYQSNVDTTISEEEILNSIMIEEGPIAHDYVPYGSWLKQITTGENLLNPNNYNFSRLYIREGDTSVFYKNDINANSVYLEVKPNTEYTIKKIDTFTSVASCKEIPVINGKITNAKVDITETTTIKTGEEDKYILIFFKWGVLNQQQIIDLLKTGYIGEEPYKEQEVLVDMNKPNLFDKTLISDTNKGGYTPSKGWNDDENWRFIWIDNLPKNKTFTLSITNTSSNIAIVGAVGLTTLDVLATEDKNKIIFNSGDYERIGLSIHKDDANIATIYEGYSPYYEIPSIGDTKDNLELVSGLLTKRIGKIVLDGSETQDNWSVNTMTYGYAFDIGNPLGVIGHNSKKTLFSDKFKASIFNDRNNGDVNIIYGYSGDSRIRILTDVATNIDEWKTWLSNNPVTVYYELAEEETINLTPTNIKSFEGVNHITLISNLEPSNFEATYLKDLVINATDTILGKDTYWNDDVPTIEDLPTNAREGEIRIVQDTEYIYIYNGTKWVPFDKGGEIDLSNYLSKDNTTVYEPTADYNPSTKKYVDDSIPTKTSQLTNDSDFATNEYVNSLIGNMSSVLESLTTVGGGN